jgi:40-residue YVTN family beta-propeller repeat
VPVGQAVDVIGLPGYPAAVGIGFGSVWVGVAVGVGGLLDRVDPATDHVVAKIAVGGYPGRIAVGAAALWVTNYNDGTVSRVNPATNRVTATIPVGAGPFGIAVDAGMLWVGNTDSTVVRIDPDVNRRVQTLRLGSGGLFRGLAAGFGSVWVASADGRITRLDSATGKILATVRIPRCCDGEFAVGRDAVWMSNATDHRVREIDAATNRVVTEVAVDGKPCGIGVAGGLVWTASTDTGTLTRIDPISGKVVGRTHLTPSDALTVSGGAVWDLSGTAQVLYRVQAGRS